MTTSSKLVELFEAYKEENLKGRYVHNKHILPLLNSLSSQLHIKQIGSSVLGKPIYSVKMGSGSKRILAWSQMHGNETTATKTLFDVFNTFAKSHDNVLQNILEFCTIYIVPILNPDGAELYTRNNANDIDLNRDAKNLSQPESQVLRKLFEEIKPEFCFNLHDQRTIFSAGNTNKPATLSFLSPAQDEDRSLTNNRIKAMDVIVAMNYELQKLIPDQVGRYDDTFNINCVGDTFQSLGVPTILFEAGHYPNDYEREHTRFYLFQAILIALDFISSNSTTSNSFNSYLKIPENQKLFYDYIIRNAFYNTKAVDLGIQFEERLSDGMISYIPVLKNTGDLSIYFGHKEYNARQNQIKINKNKKSEIFEIVIVKKNGGFSTINLM